MLVLQFIEDISDREMERFMGENVAAKWFCQFGLAEKSPDHSFFGDFRKRLGTKRLMDIFNVLRCSLKAQGLVREVFTSTDWSKASDFLSEEKSTRAPGALIQKRTVSTVFVDPTSFSWWLFSFVDASHLVSKLSTWTDRDKAIAKGLEKFNNVTASKVASDKQARFGCKGKDKYWYGY